MWPFKRRRSAFQQELEAVKAMPELPVTPLYPVPEKQPDPLIPQLFREDPNANLIAPPPQIDRFPVILGQNLSGNALSSAMRQSNQGWRYQYVDILDELLENDPDTRGVVRALILGIACGRYEVEPGELEEGASDEDRALAKAVAERYALEFRNIPFRTQRMAQLAWGVFYGVSAHEVMWRHPDDKTWEIAGLSFIHSRRLNYSHPYSWELHIYDQGLATVGPAGLGLTNGVYGMPISKYPGKFLVHTPACSGQYPTRDGEGRHIAFFMLLKRMVTRCTAQDFERVIRPWVLGYFNRAIKPNEELPVADQKDIAALSQALGAFGSGSMNYANLPSSVKVELMRAAAAMSATDFLGYLNRAIAKSLLGQCFTTEPGPNGNEATARVADKNTQSVVTYYAGAQCDSLTEGMARPWFELNYPGLPRRFCPRHVVDVSELPTPDDLMKIAKDGASIDLPIDADDLGRRTTLKLLAKDDENGRRTRMITAKDGPNPSDGTGPVEPAKKTQSPPQLATVKRLPGENTKV